MVRRGKKDSFSRTRHQSFPVRGSISSRNVGGRKFTLKSRKPFPGEPKGAIQGEAETEPKFGERGEGELSYTGFDWCLVEEVKAVRHEQRDCP